MVVPLLHFYWLSERRKKLIKIKLEKIEKKKKTKNTCFKRSARKNQRSPKNDMVSSTCTLSAKLFTTSWESKRLLKTFHHSYHSYLYFGTCSPVAAMLRTSNDDWAH